MSITADENTTKPFSYTHSGLNNLAIMPKFGKNMTCLVHH